MALWGPYRAFDFSLQFVENNISLQSGSSAVTSHSRKFGDLISHVDEIENDHELMATVVETRGMIMSWLHLADHAFPTLLEFTEIFGRVQCNTLQIITGNTGRPVAGAGVYLEASVLNHSCSPNACTVFEGPLLTVRALRKFDNLADVSMQCVVRTLFFIHHDFSLLGEDLLHRCVDASEGTTENVEKTILFHLQMQVVFFDRNGMGRLKFC